MRSSAVERGRINAAATGTGGLDQRSATKAVAVRFGTAPTGPAIGWRPFGTRRSSGDGARVPRHPLADCLLITTDRAGADWTTFRVIEIGAVERQAPGHWLCLHQHVDHGRGGEPQALGGRGPAARGARPRAPHSEGLRRYRKCNGGVRHWKVGEVSPSLFLYSSYFSISAA